MKKQYRKPEIAIEDFVLNQFIAGSCTVKTNLRELIIMNGVKNLIHLH
mgnify:CR=1 FL=1